MQTKSNSMASIFSTTSDKLFSLIGYNSPSPNMKLLTKTVIIGGTIGISLIAIAFFPINYKAEKEIKIKNSGKQVYDFLKETSAENLWPLLIPNIVETKLNEEYNNTQQVTMTHEMDGNQHKFGATITKNIGSQIIEVKPETKKILFYNAYHYMVMQVINVSNSECIYKNTVTANVPLILYSFTKRMLDQHWINGKESVPYRLKDAVEDF